jgi:hypothetical protein
LAAAAGAVAATPGGDSPVKQQLQQLLLQQQQQQQRHGGGSAELPRSLGSDIEAIIMSRLGDGLRHAMQKAGKPGRTSGAAAAAAGGSSSSRQGSQDAATAALVNELAEVLKHVGKPGAASSSAAAAGGGAGVVPSAAAAVPAVVLPRMSEYFGCVTSVPQLSPGEVRAAGVTAHPNVVAAYLRQQDGASLLALQPVSDHEDWLC